MPLQYYQKKIFLDYQNEKTDLFSKVSRSTGKFICFSTGKEIKIAARTYYPDYLVDEILIGERAAHL